MKLSIKNIVINIALALVFGFIISTVTDVAAPLVVSAVIFAVGTGSQLVFKKRLFEDGVAVMSLQKEVWIADIKEQLFFENEFINLAEDHSSYIGNAVVHIPQSGANPNVVKNRTEDVADIKRRTDTEITYGIDNFTVDPFLVKNVEELNISYSKRQSIMGQQIATLGDRIATNTLQKWAVDGSTTHVLRTSGAMQSLADNPQFAVHSTATGSRGLLTVRDFARAAALMDMQKVPKQGRYAIVPTSMYYDLFTNEQLVANRARLGKDLIDKGVVGDIHGFKIIYRGSVVAYTSAAANNLKAVSDTTGAITPSITDCAGALLFSRFAVAQALGETMVYFNPGEARSFGGLMSAETNHGAHYTRNENWGRVSIAQAYEA